MLTAEQVREFAVRGFLVLPQVVPRGAVHRATGFVDGLVAAEPPDPTVRGPYNYFRRTDESPELRSLLTRSHALSIAEQLTGTGTLVEPWQVQLALNIPPNPHRPGMHHIDGAPHDPDGRPGTFTLLVGVLLTDQLTEDAGNLWVWPGTHLTHAEYFREHGPDAFFTANGYPPIPLPEPEQVCGRAGDLLLAHYLLGHNIGGNSTEVTRRAAYFRVKRHGHDPRWREFLQDPWLDYDGVRRIVGA